MTFQFFLSPLVAHALLCSLRLWSNRIFTKTLAARARHSQVSPHQSIYNFLLKRRYKSVGLYMTWLMWITFDTSSLYCFSSISTMSRKTGVGALDLHAVCHRSFCVPRIDESRRIYQFRKSYWPDNSHIALTLSSYECRPTQQCRPQCCIPELTISLMEESSHQELIAR